MEEWEEQSEGSFVAAPPSQSPAPVILITTPHFVLYVICPHSQIVLYVIQAKVVTSTYWITPIWGPTIQESYTHFIIPQ